MAFQVDPDFKKEVNDLLDHLKLPFLCRESVEPDGDCFFHSVFYEMQIPGIQQTLSEEARRVTSSLQLRKEVVDFTRTNPLLQTLDVFEDAKKLRGQEWNSYLHEMRQSGKWADEFIICMTALFVGKDILLATNTNTPDRPFNPIELAADGPFNSTIPPITLGHLNQRHFDPIERKPNEANECLGCGWKGVSLRIHLGRTKKPCKLFYDIQLLQAEASKKAKAQKDEWKKTNQVGNIFIRHEYMDFSFMFFFRRVMRSTIKEEEVRCNLRRKDNERGNPTKNNLRRSDNG